MQFLKDNIVTATTKSDAASNAVKIRIDLPITLECSSCGDYLTKGLKLTAEKCNFGQKVLGIEKIQFRLHCRSCGSEIVITTNPENETYDVLSGGRETAASRRSQEKAREARKLRERSAERAATSSLRDIEKTITSTELETLLEQKRASEKPTNIFLELSADQTNNEASNEEEPESRKSWQISGIVELEKLKLQAGLYNINEKFSTAELTEKIAAMDNDNTGEDEYNKLENKNDELVEADTIIRKLLECKRMRHNRQEAQIRCIESRSKEGESNKNINTYRATLNTTIDELRLRNSESCLQKSTLDSILEQLK